MGLTWKQRRKRRKEAASAGDLVDSLLSAYGLDAELAQRKVITQWHDIAGPRFASRTWPDDVRDNVLWIRVSNSSWMHELSFAKEDLLTRIHELLGDKTTVKDLRFHLGGKKKDDLDDVRAALNHRRPIRRKRSLPAPARGKRLEQIERETATVEDDELRAIITEARRLLDL